MGAAEETFCTFGTNSSGTYCKRPLDQALRVERETTKIDNYHH